MDFLGRSCSSQEPNHLHGVMSFFLFLYPPLRVRLFFNPCVWPIICFLPCRLYLIIALLFLCQQFIPFPRHLIMCCVNSLLLRHYSLRMMVLSGLLTCVDVCSFIGITAQVNTLHLGLWGLFSEGRASADISVFLLVPRCHCQFLCFSLSCSILFSFCLSFTHPNQPK